MTKRRNVIVHIGTSADGYIARPDGDLEWICSPSNASRMVWCNCITAFRNFTDTNGIGREPQGSLTLYEMPGIGQLKESFMQRFLVLVATIVLSTTVALAQAPATAAARKPAVGKSATAKAPLVEFELMTWPEVKQALAELTNRDGLAGSLADALVGAEVFLGVSGGSIRDDVVATMAPNAIVFALANPVPEIHPEVAARYARVVATGRSDYPNQINNVLAFPGVFRGAFDVQATSITEEMKLAAAEALAAVVGDDLREDYVIPSVFDERVAPAVTAAVSQAARTVGVARA